MEQKKLEEFIRNFPAKQLDMAYWKSEEKLVSGAKIEYIEIKILNTKKAIACKFHKIIRL